MRSTNITRVVIVAVQLLGIIRIIMFDYTNKKEEKQIQMLDVL